MRPVDLIWLIRGLMVLIAIAMAVGKLDELREWAIKEAARPSPISRSN